MKKEYTKPVIMFESFALSTSIAGDCETIITNLSKGVCGYKPGHGDAIFLQDITGCVITKPDDPYPVQGGKNTFCYHVPTEYTNLFNS